MASVPYSINEIETILDEILLDNRSSLQLGGKRFWEQLYSKKNQVFCHRPSPKAICRLWEKVKSVGGLRLFKSEWSESLEGKMQLAIRKSSATQRLMKGDESFPSIGDSTENLKNMKIPSNIEILPKASSACNAIKPRTFTPIKRKIENHKKIKYTNEKLIESNQLDRLVSRKNQCNAFITFCLKRRRETRKKFPSFTNGQVSTELGRIWKSLNKKEKEKYEAMAAHIKEVND